MKKTYIRPEMTIFGMHPEDMILAGSGERMTIDTNQKVDQWSNDKGGWSSDNWTNDESESRF